MAVDGSGREKSALLAEDLRVYFEGVRAVDGVDLELEEGRIAGLIGPNGAGKTTLLNAISGFVPLTAGKVIVGEEDVTGLPAHRLLERRLVRTFQEVATFPALSVFENVELGALGAGMRRREARRRTSELLGTFGLEEWAGYAASVVPHGQERRLGIARAVAGAPRFLLLDEPAAGLDDQESVELADTIAQIRDDYGCAVLLVEHDMRVIFRVCETIQVLDFGKTMAAGSPDEIRTNQKVIAAYLGAEAAAAVGGQRAED
jgi:branched-chain amino acid transport system ATP-binding protein